MLPPPGLMFDTSGLRDGDGAKPGSTSNRLDFPLASGSPLINAGLFFFFLLGARQDFFFCQCFSVTEPLSGCCIRPPQRSVGVLRTRRRRNENQRLLCGVFSSWTQSSRCDTHKLLENFKLFGNYSSWRRRGCVVPKNKKCLQFSWWRACSSPSAPGSWNVCVPLAFQHFQLFAGF